MSCFSKVPGKSSVLSPIRKSVGLILELAKRDLTERYSGATLGVIWNFIYPLVSIVIYVVIFSSIMGARLPGSSSVYSYGIYLVAGIIPWTAFANTISRMSSVYLEKKHIITKIHVDLRTFPAFIVVSETITFAVTMGIFFAFLLATGSEITYLIAFLPLIYLIQQLFAYSIGFFVGIFVVFLRDVKEMVAVIIQFWFWFTPIVYVYEILPEFTQQILIYNPALAFISGYQDIFVFQRVPGLSYLGLVFILSICLLLVANFIFTRLEKDIRDFI